MWGELCCYVPRLELERAQILRARVGLGLLVADSGRARACQIMASSPSGFETICFSLLLRPTRRSEAEILVIRHSRAESGSLKSPRAFAVN